MKWWLGLRTTLYMASGGEVAEGISVFGRPAFRARVSAALQLIRASPAWAWVVVSNNIGAITQSTGSGLGLSRPPTIVWLRDPGDDDARALAGVICHGAQHIAQRRLMNPRRSIAEQLDEDAARELERSVSGGDPPRCAPDELCAHFELFD